MQATQDFSPIAPDEVQDLAIDFASQIAAGDSIASVQAWNCTVADQSLEPDPTPAARLSGSPQAVGAVVTQKVQSCLSGVTYVMEAVVITAGGETLSVWSYLNCVPVGQG